MTLLNSHMHSSTVNITSVKLKALVERSNFRNEVSKYHVIFFLFEQLKFPSKVIYHQTSLLCTNQITTEPLKPA